MTSHSTIEIDDLSVFVREAGDRAAPPIVLLHGYPSSSHMFRELIPLLAERFRVIAPDMIGYGHSDAPSTERWRYTFDNQAAIVRKVLERLEVSSYARRRLQARARRTQADQTSPFRELPVGSRCFLGLRVRSGHDTQPRTSTRVTTCTAGDPR
jgi:hypothetical protein